jgi:hypothetical protein
MARECPDCHTVIVDDRLARCAACGSQLSGRIVARRWEQSVVTYLLIGIVIAGIVWALLYFHLLPGE